MTKYQCKLLFISPYLQTERDGDEIFLKINKKKVWPAAKNYAKAVSDGVSVGYTIELADLTQRVEIELWEYDNFLFKSVLGKFVLTANEVGGPFMTDLSSNAKSQAKYSLTWEVTKSRKTVENQPVSGVGVKAVQRA